MCNSSKIVMNILFITEWDAENRKTGGVGRITRQLSKSFKDVYGINCYMAYFKDLDACVESVFLDKIKLDANNKDSDLKRFVLEKNINIIINQNSYRFVSLDIVGVKSIFCIHSTPDHIIRSIDLCTLYHYGLHAESILFRFRFFVKMLFYPLYKGFVRQRVLRNYNEIVKNYTKIVLLSEKFIPVFANQVSFQSNKVLAINNTLSYVLSRDAFLSQMKSKEKIVLVVARLEETSKRISCVLKIWKHIENNRVLDDWKLQIVGDGPDRRYYERLAYDLNLQRVIFAGEKDPTPFYQKASVFLMTSAFEGWGMTLTEAMQYGVVPLVYYTFLSLTDIVVDGVNGFIIKDNDEACFCDKLIKIMQDKKKRETLALNAATYIDKFSNSTISEKWYSLFLSLMKNDL